MVSYFVAAKQPVFRVVQTAQTAKFVNGSCMLTSTIHTSITWLWSFGGVKLPSKVTKSLKLCPSPKI